MRAGMCEQSRRGLTLIEILVVIALVGLVIAIVIPAALSARESARRSTCGSRLRQIALATSNYADSWGVLPAGVQFAQDFNTASQQVAILPFLDQAVLFNAVNFDWCIWAAANTTILGTSLDLYHCPSDPSAALRELFSSDRFFEGGHDFLYYGHFPIAYTSYAGNAGTWFQHSRDPARLGQSNGLFYRESAIPLSAITDGLSNTIFYAEHAVSILNDETERILEGPQWAAGWYGSTIFTSFFPVNPQGSIRDEYGDGLCRAFIGAASSKHPGGINVVFVDGAVKFIKDTIDSWEIDPVRAAPRGVIRDAAGLFQLSPSTGFHVWQVLTTRAGNEVVGASGF